MGERAQAATRRVVAGRRDELRRLAIRSREVVLLAALTGVVTGLGVAVLERTIDRDLLPAVLDIPLPLVALAPVAGLLLAAAARRWIGGPGTDAATSDDYLRAFHDPSHHLGPKRAAARLVAAVATLGTGAPMGQEGPAQYLGAVVGSGVQRRLPRVFRGVDHRTLMVAGAAAGVAAVFKAPATGVVFALEVPFRDDLARRMLLPALVASACGYLAFVAINGTEPLFDVVGDPAFAFRDLMGAVLLGVLAGLGARIFALGVRLAKRWSARGVALRLALAGPLLVGCFALGRVATGESLVLGSGYEVVSWAGEDHALGVLLALLLLRSLATVATVAGGGVGGLFVPLVVAGALVGRITGQSIHALDSDLFTVVGVAAFLGAGYRVPLAAVMFVAETTGRPGFVVPGLLAAVAAELVMGAASVTAFQRDGGPQPHPQP